MPDREATAPEVAAMPTDHTEAPKEAEVTTITLWVEPVKQSNKAVMPEDAQVVTVARATDLVTMDMATGGEVVDTRTEEDGEAVTHTDDKF